MTRNFDGDSSLPPVACRVCGCTEFNACITPHGACSWVELDLCSGCVETDDAELAGELLLEDEQ